MGLREYQKSFSYIVIQLPARSCNEPHFYGVASFVSLEKTPV